MGWVFWAFILCQINIVGYLRTTIKSVLPQLQTSLDHIIVADVGTTCFSFGACMLSLLVFICSYSMDCAVRWTLCAPFQYLSVGGGTREFCLYFPPPAKHKDAQSTIPPSGQANGGSGAICINKSSSCALVVCTAGRMDQHLQENELCSPCNSADHFTKCYYI